MSKKTNAARSGGAGFCSLLAILFIGLKLTNYIAWSWWWVLSPIWIPWLILGAILVVCGTVWVVLQ